MKNSKLFSLFETLKAENLDGFIVNQASEYQLDYLPEHEKRLEWLTGFKCSQGLAIILRNKAAFFTDARYSLQAKKEISKDFCVFDYKEYRPLEWLKQNTQEGSKIGYDGNLFTLKTYEAFKSAISQIKGKFIEVKQNLIDKVWQDRPSEVQAEVFEHPLKYAGKTSAEKITQIAEKLKEKNIYCAYIADTSSVSWLFNQRSNAVEYSPVILKRAIVYANGTAELINNNKELEEKITLISKTNKKILIDEFNTSMQVFNLLKKNKANIERGDDICELFKAIKNDIEIKNYKKVQKIDSLAVIKFLSFLENGGYKNLNETAAADKLETLRKSNKSCLSLSFPTISAAGGNAACIHYTPNTKKPKKLQEGELYLCDSGGQYLGGTTDLTRTVLIGSTANTSKEIKTRYTQVLKGHINLASIKFPLGTTGYGLDSIARQFLWNDLQDYAHGTGHGIGICLNVHEGPQSISVFSKYAGNKTTLEPNMLLSNEPGFYQEGKFGIRLENIVMVKKINENWLKFETLTLVPFDNRLIIKNMLTKEELNWLNNYHKKIYKEFAGKLDKPAVKWLKNKTKAL